jgi:hypothetical protein
MKEGLIEEIEAGNEFKSLSQTPLPKVAALSFPIVY